MMELVIGIVSLGALVAFQSAMRRRGQRRFAGAWEEAQAEIARGNHEAAAHQIAECIRLMPLWLPPRFLLGNLLARQGKLDAAEAQFKMAQALQPREAAGFVELGIFYITAANRIDEGVSQLQEALAHDAAAMRQIETDPRLQAFRETSAFAGLARA